MKRKHKKTARHSGRAVRVKEPIRKKDGSLDLRYAENKILFELEALELYDLLEEVYEEGNLKEAEQEFIEEIAHELVFESDNDLQPFTLNIFLRSLVGQLSFFLTDGGMDKLLISYGNSTVETDLQTVEMMKDELSNDYDKEIEKMGLSNKYKSFIQFPVEVSPGKGTVNVIWDSVVTFEGVSVDLAGYFADHT